MSKIIIACIVINFYALGFVTPFHFHTKNITQSGLRGTAKLSLTFDDGPANASTTSVLDSLKLYSEYGFNIQATFFVVGKRAKTKKGLKALQRMQDEGHIIASHSYSHQKLSDPKYANEKNLLKETYNVHQIIAPYLPPIDDLERKWYFRAPYGAWHSQRSGILNLHDQLKNYVGPIGWDVGSFNRYSDGGSLIRAADWQCWSTGVSVQYCALGYIREANEKGGGVVLLHDIHDKTAEMFKYLLVTWTGVNLFDDEKYSMHQQQQNYAMDFVSLDEIEAYDQFDDRLTFENEE